MRKLKILYGVIVIFLMFCSISFGYSNEREGNIYINKCISIKYREDKICLDQYVFFGGPSLSNSVNRREPMLGVTRGYKNETASRTNIGMIYYDQINKYLIIELKNIFYHYCNVPREVFMKWPAGADSYDEEGKNYNYLEEYYTKYLYKNKNYDCRNGYIPNYNTTYKKQATEIANKLIEKKIEYLSHLGSVFGFLGMIFGGFFLIGLLISDLNKKEKILSILFILIIPFIILVWNGVYMLIYKNLESKAHNSNDVLYIYDKIKKLKEYDVTKYADENDYN